MPFDLESTSDLNQFSAECSWRGLHNACDLHRDRRSTGHDVAIAQPLPSRANECKWIHSRMPPECTVFIGHESIEVERRHVFQLHRMPPYMIVARKGP